MEKLEYRMYGLVPYNLSPIQQGIQYGHAVVEYMLNFPVDLKIYGDTKKWATEDKTFIILNGGTTNKNRELGSGIPFGSLNKHSEELINNGIKTAFFTEPDLGDQLTAVVFLVDERVWDKEKYPDFEEVYGLCSEPVKNPNYMVWVNSIGGEQNVFLREFLKQFRLA